MNNNDTDIPHSEAPQHRAVPVETLTLTEAARWLNVSDKTLLELVASGEVPAAKPARAWVFYLPILRDYLIKKTEEETAARREGRAPIYITREARRTKAGFTSR